MPGPDNSAHQSLGASWKPAGHTASPPWLRRPVVSLVANDTNVPSFRLRMKALWPLLEAGGLDVRVLSLGRRREWLRVARLAGGFRSSDLLVFQQVKLLAGERAFVNRLCGSWVLDVDDAIMFRKPRWPGDRPSEAAWRQRRFRRMAASCRLVVAGSESLAGLIGGAAQRIVVLPTPVDLAAYPAAPLPARDRVRLAWIGLGSNLRYLEGLTPALLRLRADGVDYEIKVISDRVPEMPGVPCRLVRWSVAAEGPALADCDVGIAPLTNDLWTRGKAAYRCIQYAAAGLPAVASPVGANREVVLDGETGLWATSRDEWHAALLRLCSDVSLRQRMGRAARSRAKDYDIVRFGERYLRCVRELLGLPASAEAGSE